LRFEITHNHPPLLSNHPFKPPDFRFFILFRHADIARNTIHNCHTARHKAGAATGENSPLAVSADSECSVQPRFAGTRQEKENHEKHYTEHNGPGNDHWQGWHTKSAQSTR